MITNPPPSQITSWSVEGGIRSFVVSIPTAPPDNDLAGIIIVAKAGTAQSPSFPDDVFYRGPWSDLIVIDTDENNNALLPNQAYTIKVAAFDGFGTSSLNFSTALEVVTLQLVEDDIADEAVTNNKIPDDEIQSAKISGLIADKITAGTITGSTLQTSETGKRFVVSTSDNEAHFYGDRGDGTVEDLCNIGINTSGTDSIIIQVGSSESSRQAISASSKAGISIRATNYSTASVSSSFWSTIDESTNEATFTAGVFSSLTTGFTGLAGFKSAGYFEIQDGNGIAVNALTNYGPGSSAVNAWAIKAQGDCDFRNSVVYFKSYTVAGLPSASIAGGMIYVSNESGGAVMAFSDGTNWRRVTDRAIVS